MVRRLQPASHKHKGQVVVGIVEFINARLNEDEQIAHTSIGKHPERAEWSYQPWAPSVEGSGEVIAPNDRDSSGYPELITRDMEGIHNAVEEKDGPHIARHDPARALREVESKRTILNLFGTYRPTSEPLQDVLLELAAVYSDHPDYRTDW